MPGGVSILMTLAPQSASWRTQVGPDLTRVRSRTVNRDSAFEARGKGIAGSPTYDLFGAVWGPELPRSWRHCLPALPLSEPSFRTRQSARLGRKWSSFRH